MPFYTERNFEKHFSEGDEVEIVFDGKFKGMRGRIIEIDAEVAKVDIPSIGRKIVVGFVSSLKLVRKRSYLQDDLFEL